MTQKFWPQNGCLSGMEVSHHPDNQAKPSEYHQCAQQSQGSGFTAPRDLSVELICCSGNRILVLHDSDSSQTLKSFPVLHDWLDDSQHRTQQYGFIVTKEFQQRFEIRLIYLSCLSVKACVGALMCLKLCLHVRSAHEYNVWCCQKAGVCQEACVF